MTKVVIYCRGTNPDKLVQHPFTHRNYVFGETFENGGYVVLEASKVVPKVVILALFWACSGPIPSPLPDSVLLAKVTILVISRF